MAQDKSKTIGKIVVTIAKVFDTNVIVEKNSAKVKVKKNDGISNANKKIAGL